MDIEILYFEGCPHFRETLESVRKLVQRLGVDAEIETIEVETDRQACEFEFRGSPTVRVEGKDIQPDLQDRTAVGCGCRVYATPQGVSGVPPAELIEEALQSHR